MKLRTRGPDGPLVPVYLPVKFQNFCSRITMARSCDHRRVDEGYNFLIICCWLEIMLHVVVLLKLSGQNVKCNGVSGAPSTGGVVAR